MKTVSPVVSGDIRAHGGQCLKEINKNMAAYTFSLPVAGAVFCLILEPTVFCGGKQDENTL